MNKRQMKRKKNKAQTKQATTSDMSNVMDPQGAQDYPPEKRKQLETAQAAATEMLYNPKTKKDVQKMIQSNGDPAMSIPMTVNAVFDRFEGMTKQGSGEMPIDMKLALGVHMFGEVMELGEAMGVLPQGLTEEEQQPMLRATIQQYIQKGLKDKSIDPIELQKEVEPLLNEDEQVIGGTLAQAQGVPGDVTNVQGMQGMMNKKMQPLEVENASLKKQNQSMQGALQGVQNMPPQEGGA